jgi:HPt (histidine-containing phosphotransfer) domain-containing protein
VSQLSNRLSIGKTSGSCSPLNNSPIFNKIQEDYKRSIHGKIEKLHQLIERVKERRDFESLQALRMEVHKIAGSAGSYGFMHVSQLCKQLEIELNQKMNEISNRSLDEEWLSSLNEFLNQIQTHFQES